MRVLVTHPNPTLRQGLLDLLSNFGHEVAFADGVDALRARLAERFDAVVSVLADESRIARLVREVEPFMEDGVRLIVLNPPGLGYAHEPWPVERVRDGNELLRALARLATGG